jgi:hypothetical protein
MSSVKYEYNKESHPALLSDEIEASSAITIALDHIDYDAGTTTTSVWFKAALPTTDNDALDSIVGAHSASNYVAPNDTIQTEFLRAEDDSKIPYVYSSPRPMNHYSYFTSRGDGAGIGDGERMFFSMEASDVEKTVDLNFNELVYLKDGLVHCKNAPFGATVDIAVRHPVYGHLLYFGKEVPIYGDYPITLNTEDRASLPQGLTVRITVRNATGLYGEDAPQAFKIFGRLELYRPKPPGV